MEYQATDNGRNPYFDGKHGAEEPADTAARLELVAERDALRRMATWAYSKLHSRTFSSMDDTLELDRLKLWCEHGFVAYPRSAPNKGLMRMVGRLVNEGTKA